MKHAIAVIAAAFMCLMAPYTILAEYTDADMTVFSVPTAFDSIPTGAASYSIPIDVPPGRQGVQPNLSLTYSSYQKNGWIGAGWDLDLGSIERSTKFGLDYSGDDYVASFNGSNSELVARSAWGTNYYGAKIEGGFTKYYYSSSSGWIAYAKDGTKYYFGQTTSSRQYTSLGTFKWCLDKVLDTNGNYMTITYQKYDGEIYPYQIFYTYSTSGNSYNKYITFTLQDRTDDQISYKTKSLTTLSKLLYKISIYADGSLARQYVLEYGNNDYNDRSRLTKVKIIGSGGETTVQPVTMGYYNGGDGSFEDTQVTYLNKINGGIQFGDINGDGYTDFVKNFVKYNSAESGNRMYVRPFLSNGNGTFTAKPLIALASSSTVTLGDVDGDGLDDLVNNVISGGYNVYVYPSNGDGTFGTGVLTSGPETQKIILSDLNTDGMADLIRVSTVYSGDTQNIYVSLATGNGKFGSSVTHASFADSHIIVDMNGDGYPDLVNYDNTNCKVYTYVSNGNGTFNDSCNTTTVKNTPSTYFGDINGDGMADIIQTDEYNYYVYYCLAKGDGTFLSMQSTTLPVKCSIKGVADFNGDGLADLYLWVLNSSGTIDECYTALSEGDGTFATPQYADETQAYINRYFIDINGDGMSDKLGRSISCMCVRLSQYADNVTGESPSDFLKTVTNEYGGITTFRYSNSPEYPDNYCPFVVHPVSEIITNEVINSVVAETTFDYEGAYYDHATRDFWGFASVFKTNDDGSVVTTNYHQDEDLKGRPYQILIEDPDGNDLIDTSYTWGIDSTYNFVHIDNKTTINKENGTTTEEDYTYNTTNGEIDTIVTSDKTSGSTAETVTTEYEYTNKGTWVWRKKSEKITGSSNSDYVRYTFYGYESTTGNLLTTTSDAIILEINTYDDYGNIETVKDANGNFPKTITYDSTDTYPVRIVDALGYPTLMEWDNSNGKMTSITDPNGNETEYGYDGYDRLSTEKYPDGGQVLYTYYNEVSPRYMKKQVKESSSSYITSYIYYDGFGRSYLNKSVGENSKTILVKDTYDSMGRVVKTQGPYFSGASIIPYTQTTYDYLGRPTWVKTSKGSGTTSATGFTFSGFSTTTTDPDGNVTTETRDYLGRVIEVQEDTDGGTTLYTYNAAGDLLSVEDDDGNLTSMTYDTLGRKQDMTDPDMGYWGYTYYDNGNLWTQTDAKGQIITFGYDAKNRITSKTYSTSDPTVSYVYDSATDGIGHLYSVSNSNVTTVNNAYDEMGRVTNVTKTITGDSARTTQYTYDLSGKVLTTTYPGGYVVTNAYYEGSNLLKTVTGSDSEVYATLSDYKPTGKIGILEHGNGAITTHAYNAYTSRLSDITTISDGSVLQEKAYTYSDAGDITKIVDSADGVTYNYTYDNLHRLTDETNTGSYDEMDVSYDSIGNITSKTVGSDTFGYSYNTSHKHAVSSISVNGTSYGFSYDDNGNLASGYDFSTPSSPVYRVISWNTDNMPSEITYGEDSTSTFLYDGNGKRAKKSVVTSGVTTDSYYIGDHYEIKGGVAHEYIFAGNLRVAQIVGEDISYFHKNHLGSSSVMTDSDGEQVESKSYEPFGEIRTQSGTDTSDYKFTDQECDNDSGLYNYDARMYDPVIGRFITPDALVPEPYNPQALSRYSYCLNNPLIYIDPTGHVGQEMDLYVDGVYMGTIYSNQSINQGIYYNQNHYNLPELPDDIKFLNNLPKIFLKIIYQKIKEAYGFGSTSGSNESNLFGGESSSIGGDPNDDDNRNISSTENKASSDALAKALENSGESRPVGSAAHHIVAGNAKAAAPARAVLERFGIGINESSNGVFLPASRGSVNFYGRAVHSTLHTNTYYESVNGILSQATTRQEALEALDSIRQALLTGGL
jgi:RHS repeat-associated protein